MTSVDTHSMVHHGVLNLIDDCGPGRFDAQSLLNLGIRCGGKNRRGQFLHSHGNFTMI